MGFCGDSIGAMQSVQPIEGGSTLTSPLQLNKKEWTVANCPMEKGVQLVADHHYAKGASNTRTYLHGLYPAVWHWYDQCVGVAWWIPPHEVLRAIACWRRLAGRSVTLSIGDRAWRSKERGNLPDVKVDEDDR